MLFTSRTVSWWPREYSWGRDVLQDFGIEPRVGGLCYELGPGGFRSDWGTVLRWEPPQIFAVQWQITPRREPEPNPARASRVEVQFDASETGGTIVQLTHSGFERHGEGANEYRMAMASPKGWPYIMQQFVAAVASQA